MRILGIDYGQSKIGVSVSDILGIFSSPLCVIKRKQIKDVYSFIDSIIKEKEVGLVVVGNPLNMDGTKGAMSEEASDFAKELETKTGVKTELFDERLTTVQSERILIEEADMSREKRKDVKDKISASLMLQAYLDLKKI